MRRGSRVWNRVIPKMTGSGGTTDNSPPVHWRESVAIIPSGVPDGTPEPSSPDFESPAGTHNCPRFRSAGPALSLLHGLFCHRSTFRVNERYGLLTTSLTTSALSRYLELFFCNSGAYLSFSALALVC